MVGRIEGVLVILSITASIAQNRASHWILSSYQRSQLYVLPFAGKGGLAMHAMSKNFIFCQNQTKPKQKHFQETVTPAVRESLALYPSCLELKNNAMQELEKNLTIGLESVMDSIEEWGTVVLSKVCIVRLLMNNFVIVSFLIRNKVNRISNPMKMPN